ncbi:MAG: phosphoribosylglycinamide formyltransferase [Bacteroidales bacterium]|nr:phosphoribosylglycinamide formyltransferase [Bacteroidales bacterium]
MKRIAIFASGSGSNAQKIIEYFRDNKEIEVTLVLSNNKGAYVLERAVAMDIPAYVFNRQLFYETEEVHDILRDIGIDYIVLAGFLWLVPENLLKSWPNHIINIHPALLPKFGGKGMYGDKVHQAVIEAGEKETGITIHYVNEKYDEGEIIFQKVFKILPNDTPESIAEKIHALEHTHFPAVIEQLVDKIDKK